MNAPSLQAPISSLNCDSRAVYMQGGLVVVIAVLV